MQDTDAVSCLLCLEADEYGSMIKVCVPPGRIPPATEKVICLRCVAAIAAEVQRAEVGEIVGSVHDGGLGAPSESTGGNADDRPGPDWDSNLPERADDAAVEAHRSDAPNATDSSKE